MTLPLLWSAAAWAAPTHAGLESASWSEVTTVAHKDAGDVVVSKATVGGVECWRGSATTDVAPSKLLAVVSDIEGAKKWSSAGITEAKLLSRSGSRLEYYQYLDVPGWTMSADRFWFLTSTLEQSATRASLKWSPLGEGGGAHGAVWQQVKEAHPDAIEPTVNVGSWIFEDTGSAVAVTYSICTLPGGSIPAAIQSAATRRTLPDTVGDAIREARRRG
jgi:hypothetical protein